MANIADFLTRAIWAPSLIKDSETSAWLGLIKDGPQYLHLECGQDLVNSCKDILCLSFSWLQGSIMAS